MSKPLSAKDEKGSADINETRKSVASNEEGVRDNSFSNLALNNTNNNMLILTNNAN